MKLWQIEYQDEESVMLELDKLTILKGHHKKWFKLARDINDYFVNRTTEVAIFEDTQQINKKDWECILIPYDISIQLDKITAKSPISPLVNQITELLIMSPQYQTIIEEWDLLKEEEEVINKTLLDKFDLRFELKPFAESNLKDFISISGKLGVLTPFELKMVFLKLIYNKELTKRHLIIIELPEIYAEDNELKDLSKIFNDLIIKGCNIILITNSNRFLGPYNYILNNQVVNAARIDMFKNKVMGLSPIPTNHKLFDESKEIFLSAVDKWGNVEDVLSSFSSIHSNLKIIIYLILKMFSIEWNLDAEEFPPNINKFLNVY